MEIDEDIETLKPYINGFAAGTVAVKEAFECIAKLARLGAAVEAMPIHSEMIRFHNYWRVIKIRHDEHRQIIEAEGRGDTAADALKRFHEYKDET